MSFCQVQGCQRQATSKCSAGFRYCAYHRQFLEHHGSSADRHTWKKIGLDTSGIKNQTLKEFLNAQ